MDGDCPNLEELVRISDKHHCYLVVDTCFGCFGSKGEGFVQMLNCKTLIFARILTFENGLDVSRSSGFRFNMELLMNLTRVIYTTGFRPSQILTGYQHLGRRNDKETMKLCKNIIHFNQKQQD
jgi:8-amino-7-oxononanoate synthase